MCRGCRQAAVYAFILLPVLVTPVVCPKGRIEPVRAPVLGELRERRGHLVDPTRRRGWLTSRASTAQPDPRGPANGRPGTWSRVAGTLADRVGAGSRRRPPRVDRCPAMTPAGAQSSYVSCGIVDAAAPRRDLRPGPVHLLRPGVRRDRDPDDPSFPAIRAMPPKRCCISASSERRNAVARCGLIYPRRPPIRGRRDRDSSSEGTIAERTRSGRLPCCQSSLRRPAHEMRVSAFSVDEGAR
jgi:hypothetical protein